MRSIITVWCLLLLVGTSSALFGNKKDGNNDDDKKRRRLTEATTTDVDVDAATGTVRNSEEQIAAEKASTTCDGQMAQSLVKANDAMLAAQSERDESLQQTKEALARLAKMEQAVPKLNAQITSMETSHKEALQKLTKKSSLSRVDIQKELDVKLQELQDETNVALAEKDATVSQLTADLGEKDAKMEQLKQQLEEQAKQAEEVLIMTKEEAKNFMISQVNAVKEEKTQLQQQNKEALSLKDQAIKKVEEESKKALSRKDQAIKGLKEETKNIVEGNKLVQKSLEQAEIEVETWKETFHNRSYCDLTLIGDDLYSATYSAGEVAYAQSARVASESVRVATVAAGEAATKGTILLQELKVVYGDIKNTSTALYQEQYEKHWPTIKPHYDERVVPLITKYNDVKQKEFDPRYQAGMVKYEQIKEKEFDPRYEQLKKKSSKQFKDLARTYGEKCKEALKFGRALALEKDLPFDDIIAPYMTESCQHPEESITYFVYAWLVILGLLFRRRMFRLVFGIVGFFWGIVVAVTPLRFFIRRTKPKTTKPLPKKKNQGNASGVSVKKKGTNARVSQ
jgi:hypothetical protein